MGNLRALFLLCTICALTFTACKKDTAAPVISSLKVNGATTASESGNHDLGTTVNFEVTATDESSLGLYEVYLEGENMVLAEGILDGTSDSFTYGFLVDETKYAVEDIIALTFIIQDGRGSVTQRPYNIVVN